MSPDAAAPKSFFQVRNQRFEVPFRPAWVMGIVNVTPDSFSDGGLYFDPQQALELALQQVREGARMIDVGAESTRPGSLGVPADEQIRRAIPVIEALHSQIPSIPISIDTCSAEVAHAALQAGACIVNDTSAMRDDAAMAQVIAESHASVILMHRKGAPRDMQGGGGPFYEDLTGEIVAFLRERIHCAIEHGIANDRVAIDPGIGFGKRGEDNVKIIRATDQLVVLDRPVVIGASRKKFLGDLLGIPNPRERTIGSVTCAVLAALQGASIIRAHDVSQTLQALTVVHAVMTPTRPHPASADSHANEH